MSKKPYMYEHLEWLEIFQRKDWNDPDINPDDLAEYSEFNKPYKQPDGEDSYMGWEHTWPDLYWPDIPPLVTPDPIEGSPCSIDEDCVWAGVIGPEEMECDECFTWSQAHLWYGCGDAPWWAAYGSWRLETNTIDGECYFLFSGPVMATVCCEEEASGSFTLTYEGALDCSGSVDVSVTCELCCDDTEFTGAETVVAGNPWVGTISPACGDVECNISSNSGCALGCSVNARGSQVTVETDATDCGSFTVTLHRDAQDDCGEYDDEYTVRIIGGGQWELCDEGGEGAFCNGPWCSSTIDTGSKRVVTGCKAGGICAKDRYWATVACGGGVGPTIDCFEGCCSGCGTCEDQWAYCSWSIYEWKCIGAC